MSSIQDLFELVSNIPFAHNLIIFSGATQRDAKSIYLGYLALELYEKWPGQKINENKSNANFTKILTVKRLPFCLLST
jgi:hypothetical protein